MRVTVKVVDGPNTGLSFLIQGGELCKFGRADWADFAVPDDRTMADVHFALDCSGSTCRVRDLGSEDGVYINGNRELQTVVQDGDTIQAGQTQFRIQIEGALVPPDRPAVDLPVRPQITEPDPLRPFEAAVVDDDPTVRWEALVAAAWGCQKWLIDYCRKASRYPAAEHWQAMHLLAILGLPSDLSTVLAIGRKEDLGPRRFEILGAFGHPGVVEELLVRMENGDAATALAAAAAFETMTAVGIDMDIGVEATSPPKNGPLDPALFHQTGLLDPAQARQHWIHAKDRYLRSSRLCRGVDLSCGASDEILEQLDMQSRWEASLRDHFHGVRAHSPIDVCVVAF